MSAEEKTNHINGLLANNANRVFSEHVAKNAKLLMKIPAFRTGLARSSLETALTSGTSLRTIEGSSAVRTGTVQHNVNMLNGAFLDRGGKLVDILSALGLLNQDDSGNASSQSLSPRVLCIGPRNEVELFALIGCDISPEHIEGLDLISYSPFVTIGDIHKIPFPDNSFDIVILGWVLAYSTTPKTAVDEIIRVSRDRGIVMIGWDYSGHEFGVESKTLVTSETSRIESSSDIEKLFGDKVAKSIVRREARYPFGDEDRKIMYACILDKDGTGEPRRLRNLEAMHVETLARSYQAKNVMTDENLARFIDHIDFARNFERRAGTEEIGYHVMRSQFFANDDEMDRDLAEVFRHAFPPIHNALDARSSVLIEAADLRVREALEALKADGYWIAPVLVPDEILTNIVPTFEQANHRAPGREMVDEVLLMQNRQIMDLWIDPLFLKIAERFFESAPILDFVAGMITNAGETGESRMSRDAMYYHCDKDRIRWLKAFIYLDDVGPDSGPHAYIEESHRERLIARDGRYSDAEVFSVSSPESRKVITGPRGTVFLANTACLHKGTTVRAGLRRVLQFEWANSLFGAALRSVPIAIYRQHGVSTAFIEKYPRLFLRFV